MSNKKGGHSPASYSLIILSRSKPPGAEEDPPVRVDISYISVEGGVDISNEWGRYYMGQKKTLL